jgi:biopolymer transport protein TolQ
MPSIARNCTATAAVRTWFTTWILPTHLLALKVRYTPIFVATVVFFLQADTPAPAPVTSSSAIVEMLTNSGPVAMAVLLVLAIASIYSWTLIFGKMSSFARASKQSRRFIRTFRKATRLQEIAAITADYQPSPLALVFDEVYEAYKRQTGGYGPPRNLAPLERSAQTASSEAITRLEQRLTWLATIASSATFVGLFGTVMGIMDAFHGLGAAGSATLRAVAPGISEALITTAAGIFVAVPAGVAYNQFTARLRVFAAGIDDFARELLNSLEEIPQRGSAVPGQSQGQRAMSQVDPMGREV